MSYLLPLGPFDQVWRGPQRVVLRVEGERILDVERQDGYHTRECAERLCRLPLAHCYPLVNRVCGVHSHHHALAWTLCLEELAGLEAPPRALTLRTALAEIERIASHLMDSARIVALLGLDEVFGRLFELRELALRAAQTITGNRLVHDFARPGGTQDDLHTDERTELDALLGTLAADLERIVGRLWSHRGVRRRTAGVGALSSGLLESLQLHGWIARASGLETDLRRDHPYDAYIWGAPRPVTQGSGDVFARVTTLLGEAYESSVWTRSILRELPGGRWRGDLLDAVPSGSATAMVEAPSGALSYRLTTQGGHAATVTIESWARPDTMLLRAVLADQLVDDAVLVVASLGICTACAEA